MGKLIEYYENYDRFLEEIEKQISEDTSLHKIDEDSREMLGELWPLLLPLEGYKSRPFYDFQDGTLGVSFKIDDAKNLIYSMYLWIDCEDEFFLILTSSKRDEKNQLSLDQAIFKLTLALEVIEILEFIKSSSWEEIEEKSQALSKKRHEDILSRRENESDI